jgi:hypothetical protein
MQTVIPGSIQSVGIEPSWLRCGGSDGRGLCQGRRIPGDRPLGLCDRGGDPYRRRLGARIMGENPARWIEPGAGFLYKKYTISLYSESGLPDRK